MVDGESLEVTDTVITLGVLLDSDLSFTDHHALGTLNGLYRFRSLLPQTSQLQLVNTFILSVFYYCHPVYGNSILKEDAERIKKSRNKRDRVFVHHTAASLMPMEAVCRTLTCCMVHKTLTLGEPLYLYERLLFLEEVTLLGTRQSNRLHFPKVRLELRRRGFGYFGPGLYKTLPVTLNRRLCLV
ncbi:hypothetical protein J6590_032153 [Homalodisca vitripennis]|nr:hypothetical protein J6590_032153 [Homalodisca vitripennis]